MSCSAGHLVLSSMGKGGESMKCYKLDYRKFKSLPYVHLFHPRLDIFTQIFRYMTQGWIVILPSSSPIVAIATCQTSHIPQFWLEQLLNQQGVWVAPTTNFIIYQ